MGKLKLPTLLMITDNPAIRFWLKKQLQNEFFIIEASQKKKALDIVATTSLDFIIIDSALANCDPLQLCSECHQLLKMMTPILFLTGRLKQTFRKAAIEAGVADFLSDQLDANELHSKVAEIRKSHSLREKTEEASHTLTKHEKTPPTHRMERKSSSLKAAPFTHKNSLQPKISFTLQGSAKDFESTSITLDRAAIIMEDLFQKGACSTAFVICVDHLNSMQNLLTGFSMKQIFASILQYIQHAIGDENLCIHLEQGFFVAFLKTKNLSELTILAKQLCYGIKNMQFKTTNEITAATISVAIASLNGTTCQFMEIIDRSLSTLNTACNQVVSIQSQVKGDDAE